MAKWIAIIVLVLLVIAFYIRAALNTFQVTFELADLNISNISLNSIREGDAFITTRIKFIIKFRAIFNISFSNLSLNAYYNNVLIARSSNIVENKRRFELINNVDNTIYYTFDVQTNASTIELLYKKKMKQMYEIKYNFTALLFGIIPITRNSTYINK